MNPPGRAPLPLKARLFVAAVTLTGLAVVSDSALALVRSDLPIEWTVLALLTVASGMLSLKLPSIDSTHFSMSEACAFASVILFGPHVGVVTLALDAVRLSFRCNFSPTQAVFNFANLGLSVAAAGWAFFAVSGARPLYLDGPPVGNVLIPLALMTLAYYTVNSGLTAAIIGLSSGRSIVSVWRHHYVRLLPHYGAGAAVAMLLALAYREVGLTAIALSVPFVLICYVTLQASFGRLEDARRHVDELNGLLLSTVQTLATAIDAKDEITHDHVRRVQHGAIGLARAIGVTDRATLQALETAALLHDTGKLAVPEHILNKPGRLTAAEFEQMKRHAPIGAEILSSIDFPYPVVPIVRHHHENWDGTGYPDRLSGEEIPVGARILAVIDCYDALTSDRPYRRRMTDAQALAILRDRRGVMYDPAVVDAFLADYARIMPAGDPTQHPVSRAVSEARAQERDDRAHELFAAGDASVGDGLLAVTSLSRAVDGSAGVADLGALLWMILKQILPCDAMAICVPEPAADYVAARYAIGAHAGRLRTIRCATGSGIAGWVAVTRKPAINSDPALDFGTGTRDGVAGLRSCLAIPFGEGETSSVLALYRSEPNAFTDDHVRLLELLAARVAAPLALAIEADARDLPLQPSSALTLVRRTTRV